MKIQDSKLYMKIQLSMLIRLLPNLQRRKRRRNINCDSRNNCKSLLILYIICCVINGIVSRLIASWVCEHRCRGVATGEGSCPGAGLERGAKSASKYIVQSYCLKIIFVCFSEKSLVFDVLAPHVDKKQMVFQKYGI